MRNVELEKAQAGMKIAGRNNNFRYADNTTLIAESEELKSFLMKVKGKNEKVGIWSHHFLANRGGNNGNSDRLYFGRTLKSLQMVTAAMKLKDTCSLEGKL